jgi:hypothetical protein
MVGLLGNVVIELGRNGHFKNVRGWWFHLCMFGFLIP